MIRSILIVGAVILGACVIHAIRLYWQKLKIWQQQIDLVQNAIADFKHLLDLRSGYFRNSALQKWQAKHRLIIADTLLLQYICKLVLRGTEQRVHATLCNYAKHADEHRSAFNNTFIQHDAKAYAHIFSAVEKFGLDEEQIKAVITDEDSTLVLAGAGSGKTTTMIGKVRYLIERYKVKPEEILIISYTKASATSLSNRIDVDGVSAKTFHQFGLETIVSVLKERPSIIAEDKAKKFLKAAFTTTIESEAFTRYLVDYFFRFGLQIRDESEFSSHQAYKDHVNEVKKHSPISALHEKMKSYQEVAIANFLFENQINYEYEKPYVVNTATAEHRQYQPDFTINQNNVTVYLEHFGISKDGQVPAFFATKGQTQSEATQRYQEGIEWKRQIHKQNNTALLETYSYQMYDNTLYSSLKDQLQQRGIQCVPLTDGELWNKIVDTRPDTLKHLQELLSTFVHHVKERNISFKELYEINQMSPAAYSRRRNEAFLRIAESVYNLYKVSLEQNGYIDFSDMIHKAAQCIASKQIAMPYKYILIDEYQDMSHGRYALVKALRSINPNIRLFCVGDDWQSIYRFSGSDIDLFQNFSSYFGHTEVVKLQTTYRFGQPLIEHSTKFICKNPRQLKKDLRNTLKQKTNVAILYTESINDDTPALEKIFEKLSLNPNIEDKTIYILGRFTFDVQRIQDTEKIRLVGYNEVHYVTEDIRLRADFMTAHGSKGLEADYVIVLNCNNHEYGFPAQIQDDPIFNLVLTNYDVYPHAEERRLFYVAITRAKHATICIASKRKPSLFITEIQKYLQNQSSNNTEV